MDAYKIQIHKLISYFSPRTLLLLTVIVILSGLLRFTGIDRVPVSLYWDEVSEGYNSYSILKTGKDEYGKPFPIVFKAFDDDKMPLNIYLSAVPIKLFGLNEFSVRFTSALAGTLSVLFIFLIVDELLPDDRKNRGSSVALMSSFLLGITPWHIVFSRTGFEANVAFFFSLVGTYFFLKAIKNNVFFLLVFLFYTMGFYTYRSSVVIVPLLIVGLTFLYRNYILGKKNRLIYGVSLIGFVLLITPLIFYWAKSGDVRTEQVSVFNPNNVSLSESISHQQNAGNTALSKLLFNRRVVYITHTMGGYLSHFSPRFLFLMGDANGRHTVKDMGLLYIWEFPFIIAGILYFYKKNKGVLVFLTLWLVISPIPASLSVPSPHALRSLSLVAPFSILCAAGAYYLLSVFGKSYSRRKLLLSSFIILCVGSVAYFIPRYVYHNTVTAASDWGDGYKQLMMEIDARKSQYDGVVISGHYWQPYAYALFYDKYDPALFQKSGSQTHFDNYIFGGTEWDKRVHRQELDAIDLKKLTGTKNVLFALSLSEYINQRKHVTKIKEIKDHAGRPVFFLCKLNTLVY